MAMEYINYIKAKTHISTSKKAETPVLSEEDEQFLNHITSDAKAPPLPARPRVLDLPVAGEARGNDAQIALMNGAQNIPLPDTPMKLPKNRQCWKLPQQHWKTLQLPQKMGRRKSQPGVGSEETVETPIVKQPQRG